MSASSSSVITFDWVKDIGPTCNNNYNNNGLTLVPWQSGKSLCWDVTVSCPLAESYVSEAAREAGAVAELAATRKEVKYADIVGRHMFEPIAVATLGVFNASAIRLLNDFWQEDLLDFW